MDFLIKRKIFQFSWCCSFFLYNLKLNFVHAATIPCSTSNWWRNYRKMSKLSTKIYRLFTKNWPSWRLRVWSPRNLSQNIFPCIKKAQDRISWTCSSNNLARQMSSCFYQLVRTQGQEILFCTAKKLSLLIWGIGMELIHLFYHFYCTNCFSVCEILDGKGAGKGNRFQAKVSKMENRKKADAYLQDELNKWSISWTCCKRTGIFVIYV